MKSVLALFVIAIPMFAAAPKCKENPKVVAACYSVHGRLSLGADTIRLRLWPVGATRMLGVTAGPTPDDADAPITQETLHSTPETTLFMETSRYVRLPRSGTARCRWCVSNRPPILSRSASLPEFLGVEAGFSLREHGPETNRVSAPGTFSASPKNSRVPQRSLWLHPASMR